ncbi:hypothetical protein AB6A40_005039 [Gnathostoma spinigerum]|uniref:Methyltransferase type 11 domain-containing protein n=1 Tax=Gnathostoma spinigerum TaxID=75299 RepID=A0ABD6EPZ4_9BILA
MVEEYGNLESHYVREVYSLLASYSTKNCRSNRGLRVWRPVQKFLNDLPTGSIVIDVGCGQAKYSKKDGFVLGSDTCPEILRSIARSTTLDVQLADAVHLPYRDGSIDAALAISVIHHLSTPTRRREAVTEIARCLCVGGKLLIYVWAFEQPSGTFPSQEVLVPWHLHETSLDGRLPLVRFHHNSTKEERIIRVRFFMCDIQI